MAAVEVMEERLARLEAEMAQLEGQVVALKASVAALAERLLPPPAMRSWRDL